MATEQPLLLRPIELTIKQVARVARVAAVVAVVEGVTTRVVVQVAAAEARPSPGTLRWNAGAAVLLVTCSVIALKSTLMIRRSQRVAQSKSLFAAVIPVQRSLTLLGSPPLSGGKCCWITKPTRL